MFLFLGGDAEFCQNDSGSYARGNAFLLARWSSNHVAGCIQTFQFQCLNCRLDFYIVWVAIEKLLGSTVGITFSSLLHLPPQLPFEMINPILIRPDSPNFWCSLPFQLVIFSVWYLVGFHSKVAEILSTLFSDSRSWPTCWISSAQYFYKLIMSCNCKLKVILVPSSVINSNNWSERVSV